MTLADDGVDWRERLRRSVLGIEVVLQNREMGEVEPQVRLLVDGEDYFAEVWPYGIGCDPDDLIGPHSPLRPDRAPRDAAVRCCGCGITDCNLLVVNVDRDGDDVVWDDFRMGPGMDPIGLAPIEPHTLRFDATGYLAELDRAHRDRSWEPAWRTTGRLVGERLQGSRRGLEERGYSLRKTWQFTDARSRRRLFRASVSRAPRHAVGVELYELGDGRRRQVVLTFETDASDPSSRAAEIVRSILEDPSRRSPVAFRGEWITDD